MDNKMVNTKGNRITGEEKKKNSLDCNWWILIERLLGHKMKENEENSQMKDEKHKERKRERKRERERKETRMRHHFALQVNMLTWVRKWINQFNVNQMHLCLFIILLLYSSYSLILFSSSSSPSPSPSPSSSSSISWSLTSSLLPSIITFSPYTRIVATNWPKL